MGAESERVERLIAREAGECCDGDVSARLNELEGRVAEAAATAADDVAALRTLGDETRYTIARLLAGADRELCVCEIAPVVDVSDSAVSHALADLREAGLATRRKDGTWRYYEITPRARAVLAALGDTREDNT
jgi:DNA-binding transcriptional ArsR family regulator